MQNEVIYNGISDNMKLSLVRSVTIQEAVIEVPDDQSFFLIQSSPMGQEGLPAIILKRYGAGVFISTFGPLSVEKYQCPPTILD